MKKITLMLFALVAFCWQSNAQFTESFDTEIPATWTVLNEDGGSYTWEHVTSYPQAGAGHARIHWESAAHEDYLITPQFTVTSGISDRVSFYAGSDGTFFTETFEVKVSTTGTAAADFTDLIASETAATSAAGGDYTFYEYDLSAYVGSDIYVAIVATDTDRFYLAVDEFVNDAIPSCYAAEIDSAVAVDDCDNSQFSILVDVTDLGSSVNLEITNDAGVASTTVTATGEVTVGPFPTGTPVVLTLENESEDTCDVVLDSVLDFCPNAANTLDYYNLQWPATLTFAETEAADQMVYAQAYEAGLTDTTVGEAAAGIDVWIGYSTTDTDPSTEDWTWEVATFEAEVGNNDEYAVNMVDLGLSEGTYYYASRFSLNAGPYMYGGILADGSNGGAWDGTTNISGVLTVTAPLPPANDDFANAIAIVCGDTVSGDTTYATMDEGDANVEIDTDADIDSPNVWYSFMGTGDIVTVSTCMNTDFDTELFVFTGTSGSLNAVAAGYDECGGFLDFEAETTFTSVAGTQYYIAVEGYNLTSTGTFELAITCEAPPTCTNATATYSVVSDCETSGGFNIEVDITDMGTATDITITDDQGSDAQAATEATTLTFGPYVNGTEVMITISDDNDATCEQTSDAITQEACPPANDDICDAIALTVDASSTGDAYTTIGATGELDEVEGSCFNGGIDTSVWFTFVAPASGEVQVSTDIAGGTHTDTEIAVYEAPTDCADATTIGAELGCDQDGGVVGNFLSVLSLTDLTEGETYYIQVDRWGSAAEGTFGIEVFDQVTLSVGNVENDATFTYYPNPVKNTLSLNAQNTIEQVAMYNMLGQEVLRATPNTVDSDLDMSHLQNGTYFVKVTIANVTKTIRVIKQ
ncbi:choice-of-anchor J domain-containing protein [Winogradskyella sp. F6397]|uniref:Choice-of-anchor J domain-containing protein n=1 Tax=Winogradskyella marina TaxID=2785530 RepID=A0ABS0EMB8_9FLAO|nr:choice-of-anchor J domain-containing protein [Winogradskyella marina]MBF8151428.1 choice-of-anchor J domain-containing protein [Winogradskyella marina]